MDREPVTHTATDRELGRFPSGRDVSVTVHSYEGGAGPTVFVQAAQHGIELNGPAALRRLHARLLDAEIAGTVVVVPVANPLAFDHRSYLTPEAYDAFNSNFNRIWPGDDEGSFQERLVANVWPLVESADAAVDLHTGMPEMLEHVRFDANDDDARAIAEAFGTGFLLSDTDTAGDDFAGKFRLAAAEAGVPAITAELSNSRTVQRSAVESGVEGVRNVLRELDVIAGAPAATPDRQFLRDDAPRVIAGASGLFELRAGLSVGDEVGEGEELGGVFDPSSFERLETVVASADGVIYSAARGGVVVTGERVASIATVP
ncbi:succinylglutamate desuccinylase/aspartoacylase family protein [Halobellus ruber]|uniref:Succinylglutamate desuccinylase/aspartoacylase family protein n=1 Tax=Halobellus ruber TaxID=2761102 RepID=A0A7J9SI90_9EURY|nr:succinylglutamate desuccinylase/aspartoacylase family protein [Halobellus ruber]MBB6646674.1 succinylglutamate desuccinylase/aspartoacylase family protein [Halobellus ruber]